MKKGVIQVRQMPQDNEIIGLNVPNCKSLPEGMLSSSEFNRRIAEAFGDVPSRRKLSVIRKFVTETRAISSRHDTFLVNGRAKSDVWYKFEKEEDHVKQVLRKVASRS